MSAWPADYRLAHTLAAAVERSGVGLHSGEGCRVRLAPSSLPGYRVGWLDAPQQPLQRLAPSQVSAPRLCTALQLGERRLATVEHLLAALAGTGVSQAEIWVEAIAEAGLAPLGEREAPPLPAEPITVCHGEGFVTAFAAPAPRLAA
ncbi:MAG: UDP-3-O-acyl-N-acetylglucosamine deacetylase, partial [Cyanobium sp.]